MELHSALRRFRKLIASDSVIGTHIASNPDPARIDALSKPFLCSGGELSSLLRSLCPALWLSVAVDRFGDLVGAMLKELVTVLSSTSDPTVWCD